MVRFSVRKPFTILVAVIAVIVLGFVSVTRMQTDLLPDISLPFLMVLTPYPGASPEKVEKEVTEPMERALGTIANVENVNSVSSENYSMVQLEFADGTNMDSAMVKISSAVDQTSGSLPDSVGTPSILEISMDMIATMYVGIEREGYDIYQLSDYVERDVIPYIERVNGIASVTDIGIVDRTVQVELNKDKIDSLNGRVQREARQQLDDAQRKLDDALAQVESGQDQLQDRQSSFGATMASGIFSQLDKPVADATSAMKGQISSLIDRIKGVQSTLDKVDQAAQEARNALDTAQAAYDEAKSNVETAQAALTKAQADYNAAVQALADAGEDATEEVLAGLQEALDLAEQALNDASTDLDKASEDLQKAAQALSDAAGRASAAIDSADIRTRLNDIVTGLNQTLSTLNTSSLTSLLQAVTKLSQYMPQIQALMNTVSAMDTSGQTGPSVDAVIGAMEGVSASMDRVPDIVNGMEKLYGGLTQAQLSAAVGFSTAAGQLMDAQNQLKNAQTQLEASREQVLKTANLDALLNLNTLSGMIYAQNFAMPAGYIDDKNDQSWLLKVGDAYDDSEDIAGALLCDVDPIGTVRLMDVADVTVIDNAGDMYAKLNGHDAILLSIYKSSAAGTNAVSRDAAAAIAELEERDEGLHVVTLMDQGEYITMIVSDIFRSMILGALLAILILALFLKDWKPTVLVGLGIPLSVLLALVLMYFSDLSLNMMTLSGLSLGIGMLVDNSIVVMENIFRLRGRGLPAPRAAVQGAKQVAGAIIASTLTTVCVFLPMVFTSGTVRELLVPMALSISFCLLASLLVAMTVIPAAGSTILRNTEPKRNRFMERVQERYDPFLRWCLRHKLATLAAAIVLLVISIIRLVTMGIVILPEMNGDDIQVTITTPEECTREESYAIVDQVTEAVASVEGVRDVGTMSSGATLGLLTSLGGDSDAYGSYLCYVTPEEGVDFSSRMAEMCDEIMAATEGLGAEVSASTGGMSDMSALVGQGLTINIYGASTERLEEIRSDVAAIVSQVEGFGEVDTGEDEKEQALHLYIDKDKAMSCGLTVAQIYGQIAGRISTRVTSTTITSGDVQLEVVILDETDPLTVENLMDMEFDSASMTAAAQGGAAQGGAASSGDMASMAAMLGSDAEDDKEEDKEDTVHTLSEFAVLEVTDSLSSINRRNLTGYLTLTAETLEGYNTALLSRDLQRRLDEYQAPMGYTVEIEGETSQVNDMVRQMGELMALALLFIYLVMVAQFQSLLSPFIVLFTIPLAFTGGMLGLILAGQQLSMMSLMGFLILMGTVVNNGIVFVDYANQLRQGGMEREDALVYTGRTRMRPILMTALTTILAMSGLIFGSGMGSQMGSGMAIVIAAGLIYGTLMTLVIIPVMYDIFYRRPPLNVDVGDDLDEAPDDAAQFMEELRARGEGAGPA